MLNDVNIVMLTGRLTRDPEIIVAKNGVHFVSFAIAVNRYRGKDKPVETTFVDCAAFGTQGTFVSKYIAKGDEVMIEAGQLSIRDMKNSAGITVKSTNVIAKKINIVKKCKANVVQNNNTTTDDDNGITQAEPPEEVYSEYANMPEDDLPF